MAEFEHFNREGERIQAILDELIRVTDGLLTEKVSFDVILEYLDERTDELTPVDLKRTLIFAILEVIKENWERRGE